MAKKDNVPTVPVGLKKQLGDVGLGKLASIKDPDLLAEVAKYGLKKAAELKKELNKANAAYMKALAKMAVAVAEFSKENDKHTKAVKDIEAKSKMFIKYMCSKATPKK